MKTRFVFVMIALAALSACATAEQNTSDYWYKNAGELLSSSILKNGSIEDALRAYDKAIEIDQNNATLWAAKGYALSSAALFTNNQSRYNESLEALDKALQIEPNNPRAWEFKGLTFNLMKRYNESLDAYDKAIENIGSYRGRVDLPPNRTEYLSELWLSKAVVILQMGRTEESLDALDNATKIYVANFGALVTKGEVLTYLGRYNESIQAYNDAIDVAPSELQEIRVSPLMGKGYALMATGRYERALEVYENISGLNLTEESAGFYLPDAWRGRGNALSSLGKYNESLQAFDRAIELNSEKAPYAWTGKGDALRASGRYDEAIIAYDRALKLYQEFADAGIAHSQKGNGDSLTKLGKREEALAAYGAAVGASDKAITAFDNATPLDKAVSFTNDPYPLDKVFWNNRGNILKALGRTSEADAAFAKARELEALTVTVAQENTAEDWFKKGQDLDRNGSYNESIQAYYKALNLTNETLKKNLNDSEALQTNGLVLERLYRINEAAIAFGKVIELDAKNAEAWLHKGKALYLIANTNRLEGPDRIKVFEDAIKAYNKAIEINPNYGEAWNNKGYSLSALANFNENLGMYN